MALPEDSYPLATQEGNQIRLDVVKAKFLDHIVFNATTGTAVTALPLEANGVYILTATADCIVDYTAVATKTPAAAVATLVQANTPTKVTLPVAATGFSAIGLTVGGTLFIQRIIPWAGLANATSGEVS